MSTKTKEKKEKRQEEAKIHKNVYRYWPGNKEGQSWPVRKTLHLVQHGRCFYCLEKILNEGKNGTIDHIIPKCRGGTREFSNVVLACAACNCLKGDSDVSPEWVKERLTYFCKGGDGDPWPDLK